MDKSKAKEIVRDCVQAGGGYEAAARWMLCSVSTLHNLGNINRDEDPRQRPLDWWMRLEDFAGVPLLTQARAEQTGHVLMAAEQREAVEFERELVVMTGEFGKLSHIASEAIKDGHIDAAERKALQDELRSVKAAVGRFGQAIADRATNRRLSAHVGAKLREVV